MKILKTGKRIFCTLLAVMLLAGGLAPVSDAADGRTIRVGIFPLGQFMDWDENGEAVGYNIDYLNQLAETTHWNYEYIDCGNWENGKDMLERGELDLLGPAQRTERVLARFDYASISIGVEAAAVYTNADRDDLVYEDFESMDGLTYGVPEGTVFETEFVSQYSADHGFTPQIAEYANTTELLEALNKKEIDAAVTNIMFASPDVKLLGWFSPKPIYYIVQQGNTELLEELDNALINQMITAPDFMPELESSYFPIFNNIYFSYEEQEFAKTLPEITIGYEVNHAPLSYTDSETGEFRGITRDVLDRISEISGVKFKYEALPATDVSYDYLIAHDIYLLSNVENNEVNRGMKKMHLSAPFLSSDKVMVASEALDFNSETHMRIALATGSGTLEQVIKEKYANFEISVYPTVDECFDAIKEGKADGTIQNRYVADCTLENPRYSKLTVLPIQLLSDELSLCSIETDASELCSQINSSLFLSIMDKSIAQISDEELNNIIIKNTSNVHYQLTLLDIVREYAVTLSIAAFLILLCIGLLIRSQRVTEGKNKELEAKNVQLASAVAQADRANIAKSQFLSRMSHEIRTPMNAIVGLTEIAKKYKGNAEKIGDYLGKIELSSKVLLNIINDVLDMSAIESNKLKIASTRFDIKQVLTGISTIYYPQCQGKGIRFEMATDMEHEILIGDSLRVNQILLNLVSNAYKFTEAGGTISIFVKETTHKDHTAFMRFTVSDTGCGMSPEMLERLFKPFEQADVDTAKKHGGSGLGLSIAKNLVDIMHGAITVESQPGSGTTFMVDMPFETEEQTEENSGELLRELRVLAVDDDSAAREYTSIVLERIGVKYGMADSGEKALRMIEEAADEGSPYDVCLIDWKMPDMDGVEVTKRIRAREKKKTLIIIVSAYDLNEVEDEAKNAGADHFVSKPLFQSTVFNVLMTLSNGQLKNENAAPEEYDFTGRRVLLAEDNEMNAEIAIELLGMVNLEVERVDNGKKAVELFEREERGTFDAILMDVQMPVMDGYEASRAIRGLEREDAKTIQILAMTANAFTEDISAALSAGMNGHIAKPIDTEVLYSTLAEAFKKSE